MALSTLDEQIASHFAENFPQYSAAAVGAALKQLYVRTLVRRVKETGLRADGRTPTEVRGQRQGQPEGEGAASGGERAARAGPAEAQGAAEHLVT